MALTIDYRALCESSTRDAFIRACEVGFLVSEAPLKRPSVPRRTMSLPALDFDDLEATAAELSAADVVTDNERKILPVQKVQQTFPEMITVGRTANNDLVVPDVSVSKFHAYFTIAGDEVRLADAGSRNGTTVDGQSLAPRGESAAVHANARVMIGRASFRYCDAGGLWDLLRSAS